VGKISTTYTSVNRAGQCSPENEDLLREVLPEVMNDDLLSVAKAAGMGAALDIMLALGGSTIYVPCVEDLQRRLRDLRIFREYEGGARVKDLCGRFGLTERTIYKILKKRFSLSNEIKVGSKPQEREGGR
jgi:Mor family transcriptional regulator